MTVLSRSKNAAARVTVHDCKLDRTARDGSSRAVHTRRGHPQIPAELLATCGRSGCRGRVSIPPRRVRRPAGRSSSPPTSRCSTTCCACWPRPAPSRAWPPAVRRCAAATGRPRWCSSAPTPSGRAAVRALPRRPGRAGGDPRRARRRRLGGRGRARRRAGGGAARTTSAGCSPGWPAAARRPVRPRAGCVGGRRQLRRRRGEQPGRGAGAGRARRGPASLLVDADALGGGLDLLLGAERRRRAALAGARAACGAGWTARRCWPRCPRSAACACSPRPADAPRAGARTRRWPRWWRAGAGGPAGRRGRPAAAPPDGAEAVLADADLAVLVVPGPAAGGLRRPAAGRAGPGRPPPWSAAHLVVRPAARRARAAREVADVVGRPVLAELGARPRRGRRGPSGASRPPTGPVARLGCGRRRRLLGRAGRRPRRCRS